MNCTAWPSVRSRFLFAQRDIRGVDAPLASATMDGVILRDSMSNSVWNPGSDVSNYKLVEPDDFVIGLRSFQHGLSYSEVRGIVSPAYTVLRATKKVDPRYFRHYFRSVVLISHLANLTQGIRQGQAIDIEAFGDLAIPVPPLGEQRRIADFLDVACKQIEDASQNLRRVVSLSDERLSSAFELGFAPYLQDSIRLKFLLREPLKYGANATGERHDRRWPRYIRITDIDSQGGLRMDSIRSLDPNEARQYLLGDRDVLLARSGATVGKSFMYRKEYGPACFAGYLIRASFSMSDLTAEIFRYFTMTRNYWHQIASDSVQATIQNVSAERFANIRVPRVPDIAQAGLVRSFDQLRGANQNLIDNANRQLVLLAERRQALVTAAVTGQIDVTTARGVDV